MRPEHGAESIWSEDKPRTRVRRERPAHKDQRLFSCAPSLRIARATTNNAAKPASNPTDAPTPSSSGRSECIRSVIATFNSSGINAAITGGQRISSAKSEREAISIRPHPTTDGPIPRNTAATSRVDLQKGAHVQEAVLGNDYALAQALLVVLSVCVIAANLIMDLLNLVLDPRLRTG